MDLRLLARTEEAHFLGIRRYRANRISILGLLAGHQTPGSRILHDHQPFLGTGRRCAAVPTNGLVWSFLQLYADAEPIRKGRRDNISDGAGLQSRDRVAQRDAIPEWNLTGSGHDRNTRLPSWSLRRRLCPWDAREPSGSLYRQDLLLPLPLALAGVRAFSLDRRPRVARVPYRGAGSHSWLVGRVVLFGGNTAEARTRCLSV